MRSPLVSLWFACAVVLTLASGPLKAAEGLIKTLLDLSAPGAESHLSSDGGNAGAVCKVVDGPNGKAIEVTIPSGAKQYPGLAVKPDGTAWDLSAFGHVAAKVTNTGTRALTINVRVDNDGDWHESPWSTESANVEPGDSVTVKVIFGYSFGHKPSYDIKPSAVTQVLLFTTGSKNGQSFRIESLVAGGPAGEKPPVDPQSMRIAPKDGVILGAGATVDPATQIVEAGGAKAELVTAANGAQALQLGLPTGKGTQAVSLKPPIGRWDLRYATDIYIKVKNQGQTPVTVSAQATSDRGPTDLIAAPPLAPGVGQEIIVPFSAVVPWQGIPNGSDKTYWDGLKGSGTKFASDATATIKLLVNHEGAATVLVESVTAKVTIADLPDWLGKRPPVAASEAGDWVQTFDDEFDGLTIDQSKWNIYGPNYWDQQTHWSKDNLILGGGLLRMRFEKKKGPHNDVSAGRQTAYACGFLDTYGKWVQRYGYFETRVKLPDVPGLWPTFWLMPDRGHTTTGEPGREDIGGGAMEFDIMEHLTRWGPYRYNIAQHWDGYSKKLHKQTGCEFTYIRPDKDGFITVGFLWTPGHIAYFCNGRQVGGWDAQRISNVQSHIIFETTTGGWDNDRVDDKQLPVDYIVDYVRVWQRRDLASNLDGYLKPSVPWPLKPPY